MVRKGNKFNVEELALPEEESGNMSLTSDLPSRAGRKKKGGMSKLVPLTIIIVAGVVGFLIPTLQKSDDSTKSVTYGSDTTQYPVENEPVVQEPVVEYKDVEFATVKTNEVGFLNVRAEASTAGAKLGQLNIGDKLEVLEKTEKWVKLKLTEPLGGKSEGWVSAEYVTIATEQVEVK